MLKSRLFLLLPVVLLSACGQDDDPGSNTRRSAQAVTYDIGGGPQYDIGTGGPRYDVGGGGPQYDVGGGPAPDVHVCPKKVIICHLPSNDCRYAVTIRVCSDAVPAHLAHGDHLGACNKPSCPIP